MSCYTRRLSGLFAKTGIEPGHQNAKQADLCIQRVLGKVGEGCPAVWKEIKFWLASPEKEAELIKGLREAFGNRPTGSGNL
ncbi:MAG: hypothetical protein Q7R39_09645 [Dehalococcoidia bacterium]|nr:hypothetical protein [Dehalococcoidia bacterium]